jgi:hypothetical protein
MPLEMNGRDIYLRHTDTDGHSYVREHRDAERFIASQQQAAGRLNADALNEVPPKPAKAQVQQITDDQYRKERA